MSVTTPKRDHGGDVEKVKDTASSVVEKTKEAASSAFESVKDAASHAGKTVGSVASAIGQKAEDATASVGRGMESVGGTIRDKGPQSGILGSVTDKVGSGLECAGEYLEKKNLSGMMDDVTGLVRRNPIPALLIAVGLGYMLARTMRS